DYWVAGAGGESIVASTGQCAQHAGPTSTGDVGGGESYRQSVGDGDDAAGGSKAGVGGRDRIGSTDLSLSEVAGMRLGNGQVRQLVNGGRVGGRVVGGVGLAATGDAYGISDTGGSVVRDALPFYDYWVAGAGGESIVASTG